MRMYQTTRATMTLLGAAAAGLLLWISTRLDTHTTGGYWAVYGLLAAAGLTMALAQLFGGWTKWGWPTLSAPVFLLAFLPVLIVGAWIIVVNQPHPNWFRNHAGAWSGDIGVRSFVSEMIRYASVIAFGIGLSLGLTFDTTGPRRKVVEEPIEEPLEAPATHDGAADEPVARERSGGFLHRRQPVRSGDPEA
jgi:hypothetical protein